MSDLHADVASQLAELVLAPDRPLIVCDADEVLLQFVRGLEDFLHAQDMWLDLTTYALTGNIKRRADDAVVEATEVQSLLGAFFDQRTGHLEPVDGAAAALSALSERAQVMVLSNVPLPQRPIRRATLARHGMDYPVVANIGAKGAALAALAADIAAPVVFIDDIPRQHDAVAKLAPEVIRLHFVADPRLARLIAPAESAHARHDDWAAARAYIEGHLAEHGF
ncbi:MAG: hypothetical protein RIM84_03070 [Alphaproteobacteria bacterium]